MKRLVASIVIFVICILLSGCLREPTPVIVYVYPTDLLASATPLLMRPTLIPTEPWVVKTSGPVVLAIYPLKSPTPTTTPVPPTPTPTPLPPSPTPTSRLPTPFPRVTMGPTPVPDYVPGSGGMAVLLGSGPYEVSINPGGWQAYLLDEAKPSLGYLVDVTPLDPAVEGAYVETKIKPEVVGGRWGNVLWIRAPGILDQLRVRLDLVSTKGWQVKYDAQVTLQPGDWMGFGMFSTAEGCGGVLAIDVNDPKQPSPGAHIYNWRVQPEFPKPVWVQVARVQLSPGSKPQQAHLYYYSPGALAQEVLRQEATLSPGAWNGFTIAESQASQVYLVEVVPLKRLDNEVAESLVRPEFDGSAWQDVLRVYVPEGRPLLDALLRVLIVAVPEP